jgi:hypothetical protein
MFSQTKINRKLYGELLDRKENIIYICEGCHLWKPIPKLSEAMFCKALGIEPRGKCQKRIQEKHQEVK